MSTVMEDLLALRELLGDRSRWTKGTCARDKNSRVVASSDARACRWCLIGGACRVAPYRSEMVVALKRQLESCGDTTSLSAFNDSHKHREVLALIDDAIEEESGVVA